MRSPTLPPSPPRCPARPSCKARFGADVMAAEIEKAYFAAPHALTRTLTRASAGRMQRRAVQGFLSFFC